MTVRVLYRQYFDHGAFVGSYDASLMIARALSDLQSLIPDALVYSKAQALTREISMSAPNGKRTKARCTIARATDDYNGIILIGRLHDFSNLRNVFGRGAWSYLRSDNPRVVISLVRSAPDQLLACAVAVSELPTDLADLGRLFGGHSQAWR